MLWKQVAEYMTFRHPEPLIPGACDLFYSFLYFRRHFKTADHSRPYLFDPFLAAWRHAVHGIKPYAVNLSFFHQFSNFLQSVFQGFSFAFIPGIIGKHHPHSLFMRLPAYLIDSFQTSGNVSAEIPLFSGIHPQSGIYKPKYQDVIASEHLPLF